MATINGTSGNDGLVGTEAGDDIHGLAGNDTLSGLGANDSLLGGEGNDSLLGGAGHDTLLGVSFDSGLTPAGLDTLAGGAGDDNYQVSDGDVVVELAGEGHDAIVFYSAGPIGSYYVMPDFVENLTVTSALGEAIGNTLDNVMSATTESDTLRGGKGNDTLSGFEGNDFLDGGTGADLLVGGAGSDTYNFGAGDRIVETGDPGSGHDTVLSSVNITLDWMLEDVRLVGTTATIANGNNLDNAIIGNALGNLLQGGQGNDSLLGDAGADTLVGGKGADILMGGAGADIFRYTNVKDSLPHARDLIDYQSGDRLDFVAIDADTTQAGDQAFTRVAAFSHAPGQLVLTYNATANHTVAALDVNGDAAADMEIYLLGQQTDSANWLL